MVIAVDPDASIEVVLDEDKEKPRNQQTIFLAKPLVYSRLKVFMAKFAKLKNISEGEEFSSEDIDDFIDILGDILTGWKNFKTESGKDIKFVIGKDGKPDIKMWDHFNITGVTKLFSKILEASTIDEETVKNLESEH